MTRAPAEVGSAANSYEILAKLAMGGMAEIFLARGASAAGVERYVVLKRVLRHRADDVHFVRMFLDEARLAAQLQHPNIAQVYDIGKLGDSYFFTMEYVHGETVRTLLARSYGLRRTIPLGSVLSIMAGSAAGLHHAHERKGIDGRHLGIVHRDVSPSNLMISYEGTVKVVDFGVAKAAHRSAETQSGTVKGKISYMSPEQCRGGEIDRRADLFSLGIVFWEMLTTEKLYRRNSDFETMRAIVDEDVPPPSRLRPDIPIEVDHIVLRLLAKDPMARYQTADELHEAIENAAVRTGSALSTASLGRYMRELFGQRPEPWIELAAQNESHPDVFTVTSEPIPNNLAVSPADDLDRKLSAVPALTQRLETVPDEGLLPPPKLTSPLRVGADLVTTLPLGGDPQDLMRTMPMRRERPIDSPNPPPPLAPSGPIVPSGLVPDGLRPHAPSVTPQNTPPYALGASASHPAITGHSLAYPVVQRAPERRRSRAMIIIIPAIAVGVILGVVLAFRGDHDTQQVVGEATPADPAADTTNTMVATAEPAEPPAPPPPTPTVPPPTTEQPPTVDMTGTAQNETEGERDKKPDAKPSKVEDKPRPKPEKPAPKPDITTLFKAGDYAEVVSLCSGSPRLLALNSTQCTLAACKTKNAHVRAKKWFKEVSPAKKTQVIKDCDGVISAPEAATKPPAEDDPCKRDPMACQH